jgi:hypothetical protein
MTWGMPQEERRFGGGNRRWLLLTLFAFAVSSTFAINININDSNRIEFGQGVYQIKACDQFISLEFKSTKSVNGFSRVGNIIFKGLDIDKCKGTAMRLKMYKTGVSKEQDLFTNQRGTETGTAVIMVISKNATRETAADDVTLINHKGVNIEYLDDMQSIDYERTNGDFIVTFNYPLLEMQFVNSVTLESASNI